MPNASLFFGVAVRGVITDHEKEILQKNNLQVEYLSSCCKVFSLMGIEICPADDNSWAMLSPEVITQKRKAFKRRFLKSGLKYLDVFSPEFYIIQKTDKKSPA